MWASSILFEYAMSLTGLPYRWGGDDPIKGFDCSGLCIELLKASGVYPDSSDRTAMGLYRLYVAGARNAASLGTLAFFGASAGAVTHMGFCLNSTLMLEAGGGDSKTLTETDAASQNAFVRVRPISRRKDLLALCHPPYTWKD